jgi:hypothetical protein
MYLFICDLFNDAISRSACSDRMVSGRWIGKDMEGSYRALTEGAIPHLPGGTEESHESLIIAVFRAYIWAWNLPDKSFIIRSFKRGLCSAYFWQRLLRWTCRMHHQWCDSRMMMPYLNSSQSIEPRLAGYMYGWLLIEA